MISSGQPSNKTNADIPVYDVVAERRALRGVLDELRHHRLTLVSAPPGYGKTIAVSHYVRESDMPAAWHSLQERERDLPALFWHSLQSLEFIAPGISVAAGTLTTPVECASYIAGYLREHLTRHAVYVLDDMHYIAAAPQAEQWLRELVRQLPQTCHLVVISRALPDLPLAELIARGDVLAIGQDQLKFSAEDAAELAGLVGVELSLDQMQSRVSQLEGWPVGVSMSLRPLPTDLQIGLLRGTGGPEALFDALASGILKSLPPVLTDFLLTASTFGQITPDVCRDVLGVPQGVTLMTEVVRRNLFASQVSGGLLLHRLFRNYLQRRLQASDHMRFVSLHRRAAERCRDENQDDEAFYHYIAAECIDDALNIVGRSHSAYYQQGNMETLLRWRETLGDYAAKLPQFVYTCAMILTDRYLYADAMAELDRAEAGFAARGEADWVAETRLQRGMIHLWRAEYPAARALAAPIAIDVAIRDTITGRARHLLALVELAAGDLQTAIEHLEHILPLFERTNDSYYVAAVLQDLAIAYERAGNMASASHCLQRLVAIRRTLGQSNALALALNNLGCHYHQIGDYDLAMNTLDEGARIVGQSNNQRAESYIRWSLGDLQRDLGNDEAALRLYESAYELTAGAEPLLQQSIALSMAALYRWRGDYPLAAWLVRDIVEELRGDDGHEAGVNLLARANGIVLNAIVERPPAAVDMLEALLARMSKMPVSVESVQIALMAADLAFAVGDDEAALRHLRACSRAVELGIGRSIAAAELINAPKLSAFVSRKPELRALHTAVERLRSARAALPSPVPADASSEGRPTYSVRVFTLGDELIERDGVPVSTSEWRSSRAKEFFLYLLFHGPTSREELSLMFWPDSSTSRVRSNFHTTLYRARHALGENAILYENDHYRINPGVSVWCDALIFERYVREAQMLSYNNVRADDLYRKAVDYYRGDFLPALDAEWIALRREALHELNVAALIGAGHCARARQDFDAAITLFKRVLKVDPYREEAYRALFSCYAGKGELNHVLKQYNAMSTIFESELGILPSPETHAHVRQLTQHIV